MRADIKVADMQPEDWQLAIYDVTLTATQADAARAEDLAKYAQPWLDEHFPGLQALWIYRYYDGSGFGIHADDLAGHDPICFRNNYARPDYEDYDEDPCICDELLQARQEGPL